MGTVHEQALLVPICVLFPFRLSSVIVFLYAIYKAIEW